MDDFTPGSGLGVGTDADPNGVSRMMGSMPAQPAPAAPPAPQPQPSYQLQPGAAVNDVGGMATHVQDPLQQKIIDLQQGAERDQRIINRPLARILMHDEWQNAVDRQTRRDSELQQTQQAIQQQKDLYNTASQYLRPETLQSIDGPNATAQTYMNAAVEDARKGSLPAINMLNASGPAGQGLVMQHMSEIVPSLQQNVAAANDIVKKLNNAANTRGSTVDKDEKPVDGYQATLKALGGPAAVAKTLQGVVNGFSVPDNAAAWNARAPALQNGLYSATQTIAQYTSQRGAGLTDQVTDKDKAAAITSGPTAMGKTGPILGGTAVTAKLNGEPGTQLPLGSTVLQGQYGMVRPDGSNIKTGWSLENTAGGAAAKEAFKNVQLTDATEQLKKTTEFSNVVNNQNGKMFGSAEGSALVADRLMAIGRSISEKSAVSGTVGFSKILDNKYGWTEGAINHLTLEASTIRDTLNRLGAGSSVDANGNFLDKNGNIVEREPRVSAAAMQGFKDVANFVQKEATDNYLARAGGALAQAGAYGIPVQHIPELVNNDLQKNPVIMQKMQEGQDNGLRGVASHPALLEGGTGPDQRGGVRTMLNPQTMHPLAQRTPFIENYGAKDPQQDQQQRQELQQQQRMPPSYLQGVPGSTPDQIRPVTNTTIQLESSGNPNARTGSYGGYGGLTDAEAARAGIDPKNREQVVAYLDQKLAAGKNVITQATGIVPTDAQVYLTHNQGVGGTIAHMSNPEGVAWQNMANTAEGRQKGPDWAKQAIWGNLTPDMKTVLASNGIGINNLTSQNFMNLRAVAYANAQKEANHEKPVSKDELQKEEQAAITNPAGDQQKPTGAPGFGATMAQRMGNLMPPATQQAARGAIANAAPAAGTMVGQGIGGAVGNVPGAIAGGIAGGQAGNYIKNSILGTPAGQNAGYEAGMSAVQSLPGVGPASMAARALGAGGVTGANEYLGGGEAKNEGMLGNATIEGGKAALGQFGGEATFRMIGLGLGKAGDMIFSKFQRPTQEALTQAGDDINAFNKEYPKGAPKGVGGQPASDSEKAAYETAKASKDDAEELVKNHGIDPDHLAYSVGQARLGTPMSISETNAVMEAAKAKLGRQYQATNQGIAENASGAVPKTSALQNGPMSLPGKHPDVPDTQWALDRTRQAESNITAPAANEERRYQQMFDERSKLLAESRGWARAGDDNKAAATQAIADNVYNYQKALIKATMPPSRSGPMIANLEKTHAGYQEIMEVTNEGKMDIVQAMAQAGPAGRKATMVFNKYAADDAGVRRLAQAAVTDAKRATSTQVGLGAATAASAAAAFVIGGPHAAAAVGMAGASKLIHDWIIRKAAGGPVTMAKILRANVAARINTQPAQALAGRIGAQAVPATLQ